jgi:hypothetical protein
MNVDVVEYSKQFSVRVNVRTWHYLLPLSQERGNNYFLSREKDYCTVVLELESREAYLQSQLMSFIWEDRR